MPLNYCTMEKKQHKNYPGRHGKRSVGQHFMETLNKLDTLTNIGRLYFNLSHLHFSSSDNFVPQPVLRLQTLLQTILQCSRASDNSPISLKTDLVETPL